MTTKNKAVAPGHYNDTKISCIEIIDMLMDNHQNDPFVDYNRFQAFKYLWRAGSKDDIKQDLEKARKFLDFAINKLDNKPIVERSNES